MAYIGYGADFQLSTNGGTSYATFGQIARITLPDVRCGDVDASYIQMPSPWHVFIAKLGDGGQARFALLYNKANFATVLANVRVANNFKVVLPDLNITSSTLVFAGYINAVPLELPLEDLAMGEVGVKVSGAPTFTQGT
jgi:hypothetical protein